MSITMGIAYFRIRSGKDPHNLNETVDKTAGVWWHDS